MAVCARAREGRRGGRGRGRDNLAAHARVDHCEESGWDLDEGDASHEGGGDVSGQIPDDASAQRDAAGIPVHFVLHKGERSHLGAVALAGCSA